MHKTGCVMCPLYALHAGAMAHSQQNRKKSNQLFRRRYIYKKCDGRTTDHLWYEIYSLFFLKKKVGINISCLNKRELIYISVCLSCPSWSPWIGPYTPVQFLSDLEQPVSLSFLLHFYLNLLPYSANMFLTSGPEVIKLFPCSTQLSTKCILLINVKMPTIVGILAFISMINTS